MFMLGAGSEFFEVRGARYGKHLFLKENNSKVVFRENFKGVLLKENQKNSTFSEILKSGFSLLHKD